MSRISLPVYPYDLLRCRRFQIVNDDRTPSNVTLSHGRDGAQPEDKLGQCTLEFHGVSGGLTAMFMAQLTDCLQMKYLNDYREPSGTFNEKHFWGLTFD